LIAVLVWKVTNNHAAPRARDDMTNVVVVPKVSEVTLTHEQSFCLGTDSYRSSKKRRKFDIVLHTCRTKLYCHIGLQYGWGKNGLFLVV
jgi:hypothetical protein